MCAVNLSHAAVLASVIAFMLVNPLRLSFWPVGTDQTRLYGGEGDLRGATVAGHAAALEARPQRAPFSSPRGSSPGHLSGRLYFIAHLVIPGALALEEQLLD